MQVNLELLGVCLFVSGFIGLVLYLVISAKIERLGRELESKVVNENTDSNNKHIVSAISGNHNKVQ